ncbi:MAG: nucleotidyltransferase family protein [Patescibacteria group bacterium]
MTPENIKKKILPILKQRGITKAALFGSAAKGEMKKNSDIDILIKFKGQKSLLDLVRLQFELKKILGRKVDLLTYGGINHFLKDIILKEQKVIYEKRS